jgi:hypothetical protein
MTFPDDEDEEDDVSTEDEIEWDRNMRRNFEKMEYVYWPGQGWIISLTQRNDIAGPSESHGNPEQSFTLQEPSDSEDLPEEQDQALPLEIQLTSDIIGQ